VPEWCKPGLGGLALGVFATPLIVLFGPQIGQAGQGLGVLGGGYGAAQLAITGADWFPLGWRGVQLLALLGAVKIAATCLTVGTGGSAGDFGPSLVIGGIFGGAFGRAALTPFTTRASTPAPSRSWAWASSTGASRTCPSPRWS
jgi:CIC family chloride channel protein